MCQHSAADDQGYGHTPQKNLRGRREPQILLRDDEAPLTGPQLGHMPAEPKGNSRYPRSFGRSPARSPLSLAIDRAAPPIFQAGHEGWVRFRSPIQRSATSRERAWQSRTVKL